MVRGGMSALLACYAPRRNGMNRNKAANIQGLLENQKTVEGLIALSPKMAAGHDSIKAMLLSFGVRGQERLVNDTLAVHGLQSHLRRSKESADRWRQATAGKSVDVVTQITLLLDKATGCQWAHAHLLPPPSRRGVNLRRSKTEEERDVTSADLVPLMDEGRDVVSADHPSPRNVKRDAAENEALKIFGAAASRTRGIRGACGVYELRTGSLYS